MPEKRTLIRNINPFGLRMPPELREKLEHEAEESGRSLNAEIVHRLEQSLTTASLDELQGSISRLERQMIAREGEVASARIQESSAYLDIVSVLDQLLPAYEGLDHPIAENMRKLRSQAKQRIQEAAAQASDTVEKMDRFLLALRQTIEDSQP